VNERHAKWSLDILRPLGKFRVRINGATRCPTRGRMS
jgi:hypothetical protein